VLWGEDVLSTLVVPEKFHRVQLEYELREKTILLRQGLLSTNGNADATWELMLRSLRLFRLCSGMLCLSLESRQLVKREAVQKLARENRVRCGGAGCNCSTFVKVKSDAKGADVNDLCGRYLKTVEQVTSAATRCWIRRRRAVNEGQVNSEFRRRK